MISLPFRDSPPPVIQILCVVGGLITVVAGVIGVNWIIQEPGEFAQLAGSVTVGVSILHLLILGGLWRMNTLAWKAGMLFYTVALLLNVYTQSLFGMLIDTVLIGLLLFVQDEYRNIPKETGDILSEDSSNETDPEES